MHQVPSTARASSVTEAPTGFDNRTNGFSPQGPPFDSINEDNVVPLRSFNDNRFIFEEVEAVVDGLGPTYNAQSCRECHQNVATGGASQIAEHRTGRMDGQIFFESLGGSLIQSRATHSNIVERVNFEDNISTFRISTNTLGAGFVEAIANSTLLAIRDRQPAAIRGTALEVPVLEADSVGRIGRFGWKAQHASLESFSADAYLNEMGITTPLFPEENHSSGEHVGYGTDYDKVADPEDDGIDVVAFADFMRATKAPARGRITANVRSGERIFAQVGCAACHVPVDHDRAGRHANQRKRPQGIEGARQQGHPSLQRFPPARHWHRGWHPVPADAGIRSDRTADQDCTALGTTDPQSPDARRAELHEGRSDPAP